jgi:hypothetical protein
MAKRLPPEPFECCVTVTQFPDKRGAFLVSGPAPLGQTWCRHRVRAAAEKCARRMCATRYSNMVRAGVLQERSE